MRHERLEAAGRALCCVGVGRYRRVQPRGVARKRREAERLPANAHGLSGIAAQRGPFDVRRRPHC